MTVTAAALATLEQLLNWAIRHDPEAFAELEGAHGRIICIELVGLGQRLYLIPDPGGIQLLGDYEDEADCTISGTPWSLALMGQDDKGGADQLFEGAVQISGDSELGKQFGRFVSKLDIDWEEELSKLTGDVIAHEMGNLARGLTQWGRECLNTSGHNIQEYLQEEIRLLPTRYEIERFLADVDRLRDDLERLDARICRLRNRAGTAT